MFIIVIASKVKCIYIFFFFFFFFFFFYLGYDVENKENQQPISTEQTDMTVAIYGPNGETPVKFNGNAILPQPEELKVKVFLSLSLSLSRNI